MNLLITGSHGFIGSHFTEMAMQSPKIQRIVALDCLTYAANKDVVFDPDRVLFCQANIRSKNEMVSIFRKHKITHVVHLAAESHVDRSITGPSDFIQTNIVGTHNLLEASLITGVSRFIHVSTDEVYGSVDYPVFPDAKLNPSSPYSASKASADMLCIAYNATYKLETVITRCVNNYGPRQYPEKLIPVVIRNALANEKIPIYGNGDNYRDWIHVSDHCHELMEVLMNAINPQIVHISGGNDITNIRLVKQLLKLCGKDESLIQYVDDRKGHDKRYTLAQARPHSRVRIDFDEGLRRTVEWYSRRFAK